MIRPILTEVLLFVTPFAVYALFLYATRTGVLQAESWPRRTVAWLTVAAVVLLVAGFVVLAQLDYHPAGSTYVPPHMEDGKLIPGHFK
jgi:heme/copper-type cytochrome/quinol oxidase subunit 3